MKKARYCAITVFLLIILLPSFLYAQSSQEAVLFFYSKDCGSCKLMKPFLEAIMINNPSINIEFHEVEEDAELWESTCSSNGIPLWGVPRIFIGDKVFAGWFDYEGQLVYYDAYYGYLGYKKQIVIALEDYFKIKIDIGSNPLTTGDIQEVGEDCGC